MRIWVSLLLVLFAAAPHPGGSAAWAQGRVDEFYAKELRIDRLAGRLRIEVVRQGPITLRMEGDDSELERIVTEMLDGVLVVRQEGRNWGFMRLWRDPVLLDISVPEGTAIAIADMKGDTWVGDTNARFSLDLRGGDARVGRVSEATVRLTGKGDITLAETAGHLDATVVGSGDIAAAGAQSAQLRIEGSGDIKIGAVNGPFNAVIMGSGDITAAEMNGPLDVEVFGSGQIRIFRGESSPTRIVMNGTGEVEFDGMAHSPHIIVRGSGSVDIRSVRGETRTERQGDGAIRLGRD